MFSYEGKQHYDKISPEIKEKIIPNGKFKCEKPEDWFYLKYGIQKNITQTKTDAVTFYHNSNDVVKRFDVRRALKEDHLLTFLIMKISAKQKLILKTNGESL